MPPVLVGEWFPILLSLENLEAEAASSLTVSAWLRDAADPLVSRILLDNHFRAEFGEITLDTKRVFIFNGDLNFQGD